MPHPMKAPTPGPHDAAALLRRWRQRRGYSQLALALDAGVSTRHLSFLENGRAGASRELLLRVAQCLDLPLRERNALLLAAGFAPEFSERPVSDPTFAGIRDAVRMLLRSFEPSPALAVDRHWHLIEGNRLVPLLLAGVSADLLAPPVNVLRLTLHPRGLASAIENFAEWKHHLLARLRRDVHATADPTLIALLEELRGYGAPVAEADGNTSASLIVPLRLRTPAGMLALISTTTVFGTAADVTVAELAIESFLPADAATAGALRQLAAAGTATPAARRNGSRASPLA